MSLLDIKALRMSIAEGMAQGLTDEEIAACIMAVGSDAHVKLGRLVKPSDLVGVIRHALTEG